MKSHIINFPTYLQDGYTLGNESSVGHLRNGFDRIVFVGMGGSGMASLLLKTLIDQSDQSVPCEVINDYVVPNRVGKSTLMIVASYSGNTEETLAAMHDGLQKGAHMVALASGGQLLTFAHEYNATIVHMPTGIEPRAAVPYSFGIQGALLEQLGVVEKQMTGAMYGLKQYITDHNAHLQTQAQTLADHIADCIPVIYTTPELTGIALRFRQQLNENSRMLCRHHIIPEMNHNELLGRQEGNKHVKALFLVNPDTYVRNKKRIELTKEVLHERHVPYFDIVIHGETLLEKMLIGMYTVDRISYYTAVQRNVNPDEVKIIERLKGELGK